MEFGLFSLVHLLSRIGSTEDSSSTAVVVGAIDELTCELTGEELSELPGVGFAAGSSSEDNNWIFDLTFPELKFQQSSSLNTTFLLIVTLPLMGLYR